MSNSQSSCRHTFYENGHARQTCVNCGVGCGFVFKCATCHGQGGFCDAGGSASDGVDCWSCNGSGWTTIQTDLKAKVNADNSISFDKAALMAMPLSECFQTPQLSAALAKIGALKELLNKYGLHPSTCPGPSRTPDMCSCGINAALI